MLLIPSLLSMAVSAYLTMTGAAYFGQNTLQYRPTHEDRKGLGVSPFESWRDDAGVFLAYVRPSTEAKRIVLFFHGMGGEAMNWRWYERIVPSDQILVLAEYPGYGARGGRPSQATLFHAAEDLLKRVQARWQVPITIIGESLGSGVACYVASRHAVDRLALVAPFTSVTDVVRHHAPFLPAKSLLKDQYPSLTYIKNLHVPLHILHGTRDAVIPLKIGHKLFDAYPGVDKTLSALPGFNHYTINTALARSELAQPFRQFISGQDPELLTHR